MMECDRIARPARAVVNSRDQAPGAHLAGNVVFPPRAEKKFLRIKRKIIFGL
jgi:hypothetical protein